MARGSGGIYKRGKVWHIHYSKDGILYRESAKTSVRADALSLLKKRLGQTEAGEISPGSPTIAQMLDVVLADYEANERKSINDVRNRIANLKERWGNVKAKQFTASNIQMHINERLADEVASATINRELSILRRAFRLALERGMVATMPKIRALKEDNARQGFFTDAEYSTLRDALPEWMRPLCAVAYFTGCRLGELRELRWSQVDLTQRVIRLEKTKNGGRRTVPMTEEIHALLSAEPQTCEWVFSRDGQQIGKYDIYDPWIAACKAAGLDGRVFHDFRRTGVRNMIRAGVPRQVAMAISGHKTDSMFRRYDIVDETDLLRAADRMQQYIDRIRAEEKLDEPKPTVN